MKRVKGITKTSLIHNGKLYVPQSEIDIEVADKDYDWLIKDFVTISQTEEEPKQEENPQTPKADESELPKLPKGPQKPNTMMARTQKPTIK